MGFAELIELLGEETLKLTNWLSHFSNDLSIKSVPLNLNQLVQETIEAGRVDQSPEIDLLVKRDDGCLGH